MRIRSLGLLGAALVAMLWAPTVNATTALKMTTEDLAVSSDLIVTGRCVDASSGWEGRVLVTRYTIEVSDTLKGSSASQITVVALGGIDTNRAVPVAVTYADAPKMALGEEVFLFLDQRDAANGVPGTFSIAGFSQGKYSILQGSAGAKVARGLGNLMLVDGKRTAAEPAPTSKSLDAFTHEVRGYLGSNQVAER